MAVLLTARFEALAEAAHPAPDRLRLREGTRVSVGPPASAAAGRARQLSSPAEESELGRCCCHSRRGGRACWAAHTALLTLRNGYGTIRLGGLNSCHFA